MPGILTRAVPGPLRPWSRSSPRRGRTARIPARRVCHHEPMDDHADYLPEIYQSFRRRFGDVVERHDAVAAAVDTAGPLDEQSVRLTKLGIALGAQSEGAVRSNVRKALDVGVSREAIEHVILLGLTTCGFPATIAAWKWATDVLDGRP